MREWFRIQAKAGDPVAELHIYGDIGQSYWDDSAVSAASFLDAIKALPSEVATVRLRVNSLGGDVFDGIAIANTLRAWAQAKEGRVVEAQVDGIAASAASVVIMAGSVIRVADNALVMVHNPYTWTVGNAAAMRKVADDLDAITGAILATYKWHSELSDDELRALLDNETWLSADEAIAKGFATEKVEGLKAVACLDRRAMAKMTVPTQFKAHVEALLKPEPAAPVAMVASAVLKACREGGCLDLAETLLAENATADQVTARVTEATQKAQQVTARAADIRALCVRHKLPELADTYVAGGMSVDAIKAQIAVIVPKLDQVAIDAGLSPGGGGGGPAPVNIKSAYERLH